MSASTHGSNTLIPGFARYAGAQATYPLLAVHPATELATDEARTLMRFAVAHPKVKPANVAALRREVRQHAVPDHASLLDVRDVGVHEGQVCVLTASVRSTLADGFHTKRAGLEDSVGHALSLLSALASLHASGRTHGRISPRSLYWTPSETLVLAPYAWLDADTSEDFHSPEMALGAPAGPATDLYGVGATLYWMLTGDSPRELFHEQRGALRFRRLPPAIADVVFCATRFEPSRRYRSAVFMATALQKAADSVVSGDVASTLPTAFGMRPAMPARRPARGPAPAADAASTPALPENEQDRLATLFSLAVLDTQTEERFDRHTRLAQRLIGTSTALVSLVDSDRQWFKSRMGLDAAQTPREHAFCAHAILSPDELFEVPDASRDPRFQNNPLVTGGPNIRFYAGQPLRVQGRAIGTLCVIDDAPRRLSDGERAVLAELAAAVEEELVQKEFDDIDAETGLSTLHGFARHAHLALGWRAGKCQSVRLLHITAPASIPPQLFSAALVQSHQDADAIARLDAHSYCVMLPSEVDVGPRLAQLEAAMPQGTERLRWVGVTVDPGDESILSALVAHAQVLASNAA